MSLTIGRLSLDDPEAFPEAVGEAIARVGSAPVPGSRSGLSVSAGLTSFPGAAGDTLTDRQRVRAQLRSMLNNLPYRLAGLYLAWTEDGEQDGWYVPGTATFDLADRGALPAGFWRFTGLELALVGRARSHRRAVSVYLRDRRVSTRARDYLSRIYSTDFSGMTPWALTWLPSTITDPVLTAIASTGLSTPRTGFGGCSLQAIVGATDLGVASFDQAAAARNLGDVIVYDRRGTLSGPTGGPAATWQEVYGPDWPCAAASDWRAGADVPVLDNSLCRARWDTSNTAGFAIDLFTAGAWAEQGKVLIERVGDTTGYLDTLVSADVMEWTPDRAVVRALMRRAADAYSREEVYITLQRGWTGPRFEVYPARKSTGLAAGAGVHVFRVGAPAGTEVANKFDAALQTVNGAPSFAAGAVGAATFSGENWILMSRAGVNAIALAALQAGASGRVENGTNAYGSARNGISIRSSATAAYVSAHLGMNTRNGATAIDAAAGTTYDGARDLGKEVLYDSRSPQTIVAR